MGAYGNGGVYSNADGSYVYYTDIIKAKKLFLDAKEIVSFSGSLPNAQYYYDIAQKKSVYMMDMVTGALYPSITDEEVLLMCIFTYHNRPIPITYIIK